MAIELQLAAARDRDLEFLERLDRLLAMVKSIDPFGKFF
ncbi:hypothetical protein NOVOSPHI9U_40067 [Novosphingobium sp. 9U]|nr:hypothetical protein NOVOSPHI9U_40067 [Novosphingobium sp. 9U]